MTPKQSVIIFGTWLVFFSILMYVASIETRPIDRKFMELMDTLKKEDIQKLFPEESRRHSKKLRYRTLTFYRV